MNTSADHLQADSALPVSRSRLLALAAILASAAGHSSAAAQTTDLVSVASDGTPGDDSSFTPSLSDDANRISFSSNARNLVAGDTNQFIDVFVRDRAAGTTVRASVSTSGAQ